ncbi:hypothetical protein SPRG_11351 [Saprolegnia parasitica CBS 223.65]|uniref:Uncharacterized protein n=1 Tax=Saprolegnia parasitica (strain CBS 223.65) TaxID=695850 RepID=A0A067BV37_SAPPC|nr:hypothetical protein SPRG_11351 [Saprolegnia parasitica CBS 223.65]KDO22399.1 hypothetical protein SPRG_11351 [Saprolegnia parasitica CBS 223.65]|eukprot:XP_012206922.1 hypothetical protein SPRG_11351 [Saprolegnia parasitica CBS 223.65]
MGNVLGNLWSALTDTAFYALVPPDVFGTEHWVFVECKRIALAWHVRPIPSGRAMASMHVQPNLLSASVKPCMLVSSFREHIVSKREADAGAATYILSYVCYALAGTWNYGFVMGSQWREATGYELVIKADTGAVIIPLNHPTLIVLTLAGYALRPFDALPLASHSVAAVQTDTATIVGHFLAHGRNAGLDYAALDLLSAHLSPPPVTDMLLPCIFLDGTQCEVLKTRGHCDDQLLAWYIRATSTTRLDKRPTKLIKSYQTNDAGTLTAADVPDLERARVGAMLQTTKLATIFDHYGGFPPFVYVRKEMKMAWDLLRVNFTLPKNGDGGAFAALQSVLLVLFCVYLGVYHDFNLLLLRAVKSQATVSTDAVARTDAVLWFRGGHVTKYPCFDRQNLSDLMETFRAESRVHRKKYLLVGDGYLESDIRHSCAVIDVCHIISSSAQYRIKDDDPRVPLIVPAWSKDALCAALAANDEILPTLEERYAHSGGSLRAVLDDDARMYIQDIYQHEHYMHVKHCRQIVDARVDQRFWTPKTSVDDFEEMLGWVETTANASLHQSLFEAFLHKLAYDGILELVLTRCDISTTETLDLAILPQTVGQQPPRDDTTDDVVSKQSCMAFLWTGLADEMYWTPDHVVFPGVDAILVQGQCICYLHMTVTPVHSLQWDTITEVLQAVQSNARLAGFEHKYVIVAPPSTAWVQHVAPISGLRVYLASARHRRGTKRLVSLL